MTREELITAAAAMRKTAPPPFPPRKSTMFERNGHHFGVILSFTPPGPAGNRPLYHLSITSNTMTAEAVLEIAMLFLDVQNPADIQQWGRSIVSGAYHFSRFLATSRN